MSCDHNGSFHSPGSVLLSHEKGPMLLVPVICQECGDVRLRFPMIEEEDEKAAEKKMQSAALKERIKAPANFRGNVRGEDRVH